MVNTSPKILEGPVDLLLIACGSSSPASCEGVVATVQNASVCVRSAERGGRASF